MHDALEDICDSLDKIAEAVLQGWSDNRTLLEVFGWNAPAVTRHDLSNLAKSLADRIRKAAPDELDADLLLTLVDVPRRLQMLQSHTIPQLYNGNVVQSAPTYISTIQWIENILEPILYWRLVNDTKVMPVHLARRLRSLQADLNQIVPEKDLLEKQIQLIREANEAAESLPTDLESLKIARNEVGRISTETAALLGKIDEKHKDAERLLGSLVNSELEASKLVQQCNEAYRVTTTVGLAASFDQRAISLNKSVWAWVSGLLIALIVGAYIGSQRVELLTKALQGNDPQWGVILIHAILSLLSVGAPLWFAWLATKQIGQRFRLSEDYSFKASVAKAYEGYRREAARIDEAFEARLFSSALSRLEEAPLRLIEEASHGSPWHELISSDAFRSAMEKVPALREKFIQMNKLPNATAEALVPVDPSKAD